MIYRTVESTPVFYSPSHTYFVGCEKKHKHKHVKHENVYKPFFRIWIARTSAYQISKQCSRGMNFKTGRGTPSSNSRICTLIIRAVTLPNNSGCWTIVLHKSSCSANNKKWIQHRRTKATRAPIDIRLNNQERFRPTRNLIRIDPRLKFWCISCVFVSKI